MLGSRTLNGSRRSRLLIAAALLTAVASVPGSASHNWGTSHWARTSTLGIRLGDNVGVAWDTPLRAAAADWSRAAQLDTIVVSSGKDPLKCAPTYGRVEVCNAAYGSTGWLGLGQVWSSNGHVVQGTAKLNNTYFRLARYNTAAWRRSVMCQEIGHTLGLDHQDVNMTNLNLGTCMDYTNDPTGTKGTNGTLSNLRPNTHDYGQLTKIYGHLDGSQLSSTKLTSSTSAAQAPTGSERVRLGRAVGLARSEWGRAVAADARGRPRLFVRDLGDNVQVATFVIWAEHTDGHSH